MTFISDLSARAIAFITAIQTVLVNAEVNTIIRPINTSILTITKQENPADSLINEFKSEKLKKKFSDRASELIGSTVFLKSNLPKSNPNKEKGKPAYNEVAVSYAINLSANLVEWMARNRKNGISDLHKSCGGFPTPYNWRLTIERILYEKPVERIRLAIALEYLPLQIVLALGAGVFNATGQRSLQMWNPQKVNQDNLDEIIKKRKDELLTPFEMKESFGLIKKDRHFLPNPIPKEYEIFILKRENVWSEQLKKLPKTKREKKEEQEKEKQAKEEKEQAKTTEVNGSEESKSREEKIKERSKSPEVFVFEVIKLLLNHSQLIEFLKVEEVPLSFELIFSEELIEIEKNRKKRKGEEMITSARHASTKNQKEKIKYNDDEKVLLVDRGNPFKKGQQMGIRSLAISGGGIRSATFNLGILQGFAEKKLIGKFDYLSTVSGGGYIGSWLTTWIKRNQSVVKVSNRLCTQTSPDPAGAELKPIKWLRMYSNYFAPNASLMSVDSWTVGITWLRNTLLNQIVIFLLFLSLLFAGNSLYQLWSGYFVHDLHPTWPEVLLWSIPFILLVAILSGVGMSDYENEDSERIKMPLPKQNRMSWNNRIKMSWIGRIMLPWIKRKKMFLIELIKMLMKDRIAISQTIILISIIGGYIGSAWLSSAYYKSGVPATSIEDKLIIFFPTAIVAFACLLLVSYLGNYIKCIEKLESNGFKAVVILFTATLFSALFGWICLAFVSVLLENMPNLTFGVNSAYAIDKKDLQFILGVPIIIEVFAFAIIARMALLGKYFPDERREWWGRIGADIHRICFLWILVFTSALLGWTFIQYAYANYAAPTIAATGGWVALVGICVKAAFSSKTAGKGEENGRYATFLSILSFVGPYLFILGLLILLPALTKPLLLLLQGAFINIGLPVPGILFQNLWVLIFCSLVALGLATRLGVNEFSMYNFYKNRLVRAYLGGTRRSTKRQKTANPYTGFDMEDDELLYKFCHAEGYHGPYHILNCALNASQGQELDRQDRKAESFIFSPLYCGFDFSMARDPDDKDKSYDYAYRETKQYAFKGEGPYIGTAMAISGAAVNPNRGYHSSPPIAFLLTIFNAQMGRWLGNPRKSSWQKSDPRSGLGYMIYDLINNSTTRDKFVSLSDGGHFDNMGLYEMVRRKCPYIILCDAEQDNQFTCEGLANAIRRCRIDFGAEITIDISKITERTEDRYSKTHYAIGNITYVGENQTGVLLYIKSSITGNEPVDVYEYALKNKTFPHQTTADQFFNEEQFETYRKLGLHIAQKVLSDKEVIKEFKWEDKKESLKDTIKEIMHPFQAFYNSIKNLFVERSK